MEIDPDILPKYWRFKRALHAGIESRRLAPGDRLPGVRELARTHSLSVGTVRKAIGELVAERILVARQGRGTFVGTPDAQAAADGRPIAAVPGRNGGGATGAFGIHPAAVKTIRFCAQSTSPIFDPVWERCVRGFAAAHPHARVEIVQGPPEGLAPDVLAGIDVIETGGDQADVHFRIPPADLAGFDVAPPSPSRGKACPWLAPLHVSVACLAYNADLLRALGLEPPAYRNFRGQLAYLETVFARMRSRPGHPLSSACNLVPRIYLGDQAFRLIRDVQRHVRPAPGPRGILQIEQAIRMKELFLHGRRPGDFDDAHFFTEGRAPVLSSWTAMTMGCTNDRLSFQVGVHPFFSADDTIYGNIMGALMNAETESPVECVRFIRYLQSAEPQSWLKACGGVPSQSRDLGGALRPADRFALRVLADWTRRISLRPPPSRYEQYMLLSVVEPELYAAKAADGFLRSLWSMGDGYTRFVKSQKGEALGVRR